MKVFTYLSTATTLVLLLLAGNPAAASLLLTFDCTISGTGNGTNNCAEGPAVAEVLIEELLIDVSIKTGILTVKARTTLSSGDFQLKALFLNFGGALNSNGLYADLPLVDEPPLLNPQNDFNTMEFSFNGTFTGSDLNIIEVVNGGTTALNYKGFDLMLCDTGVGQCDFDLSSTFSILGYLQSGNGFKLTPELFDALTDDSGNANNPDELLLATNPCMDFVPGHLRAAVHITPATSGDLKAACLAGGSYGPYYGDGEEVNVPVPEPTTIALLVLGLAGLGFGRTRHR